VSWHQKTPDTREHFGPHARLRLNERHVTGVSEQRRVKRIAGPLRGGLVRPGVGRERRSCEELARCVYSFLEPLLDVRGETAGLGVGIALSVLGVRYP